MELELYNDFNSWTCSKFRSLMFEFTNRRFQFLAYALSLKISVPGLRPQPEDFSRLSGRQELKIFEISLHSTLTSTHWCSAWHTRSKTWDLLIIIIQNFVKNDTFVKIKTEWQRQKNKLKQNVASMTTNCLLTLCLINITWGDAEVAGGQTTQQQLDIWKCYPKNCWHGCWWVQPILLIL